MSSRRDEENGAGWIDGPVSKSRFPLCQTEDGRQPIEVSLEDETVWTPHVAMAELFQVTKKNISLHIMKVVGSQGRAIRHGM